MKQAGNQMYLDYCQDQCTPECTWMWGLCTDCTCTHLLGTSWSLFSSTGWTGFPRIHWTPWNHWLPWKRRPAGPTWRKGNKDVMTTAIFLWWPHIVGVVWFHAVPAQVISGLRVKQTTANQMRGLFCYITDKRVLVNVSKTDFCCHQGDRGAAGVPGLKGSRVGLVMMRTRMNCSLNDWLIS